MNYECSREKRVTDIEVELFCDGTMAVFLFFYWVLTADEVHDVLPLKKSYVSWPHRGTQTAEKFNQV